jgi:hypothetical protein
VAGTINGFGPVINDLTVVGAGHWPVITIILIVMFAPGTGVVQGGGAGRVISVMPIMRINYGLCR